MTIAYWADHLEILKVKEECKKGSSFDAKIYRFREFKIRVSLTREFLNISFDTTILSLDIDQQIGVANVKTSRSNGCEAVVVDIQFGSIVKLNSRFELPDHGSLRCRDTDGF